MTEASAVGLLVMRAHYALTVVGAGSSGMQLLLGNGQGKPVDEFWGAPVTPPLAAKSIGSMWLASSLISVVGLIAPIQLSPFLMWQSIYKGVFFLTNTIPALLLAHKRKPSGSDKASVKVGLIFASYAVVLPWFLPWGHLLRSLRA